MIERHINRSFAMTLLYFALFVSLSCGVMTISELIFMDFVHGNPHRTQQNAIDIMVTFTPIIIVIAIVGSVIVFTLPQAFQAVLASFLVRQFGNRAYLVVIITLPLTTVIACYCYDYLTPSDMNFGFNEGPDWTPYQHGLTMQRYLKGFTVQAPLTLLSVLYLDAGPRPTPRRTIHLTALSIAIIVGVVWGYLDAEDQFQFLGSA